MRHEKGFEFGCLLGAFKRSKQGAYQAPLELVGTVLAEARAHRRVGGNSSEAFHFLLAAAAELLRT